MAMLAGTHYRDLVLTLLTKELKLRYKNTVLGYAWSLLHPLAFASVFFFVFRIVVRIEVENYALFLICGLFPWQWLGNSTGAATDCLVGSAALIKRVPFPRAALVFALGLNDMIHFLATLPIILAFMALHGIGPSPHWLWVLPILLGAQLALVLGVAFIVGTVNVFFRDIARFVEIGMMLWFYLTPILYPVSLVPAEYRWLVTLNPFGPLVICWRSLFLEGAVPLSMLGLAVVHGGSVGVIGYGLFRRKERRFAELI